MAVKIYPPQVSDGQSKVLAADFPKTNQTLTAVTGLTLNLDTGHWYLVTGELYYDGGVTGAQFDLAGGSATATGIVGEDLSWVDGVAYVNPIVALNSALGPASNAGGFTGLTLSFVTTIQVNAGGTFIPRFAQVTTDVGAATLKKYSTLTAQDVTP